MKETFGQRFTRLRKEKNLTQEYIANKFNISAQAVSKWENDISLPDITILADLAELFDITTDELLGKEKHLVTTVLPEEDKKDINKKVLRIKIISGSNTKVNINIPIPLLKICIELGLELPQIKGNNTLSNLDLKQIYQLIEKGLVGEIMTIESDDAKVLIVVE